MAEESERARKLAEAAFGQAVGKAAGKSSPIEQLIARFEARSIVDEDRVEYWLARDLQKLLSYADWRNFVAVVAKAKDACRNSGHDVADHFVDVNEMVEVGSGAEREIENIKLTRYACYLTAQNSDSRKKEVAFAQTYFAIQTRRQEIQDDDLSQYVPLPEEHKRVLLRDEIKEHNKHLASAAKGAGVVRPVDFAIFQTFGYKGLYGGLDRPGIQRRKGLKSKDNILDHMGSTELAANLFRATQTEDKLRRETVQGKDAANVAHFQVGKKVRDAIHDIGGTMPEHLPRAENIRKVAKRLKTALRRPPLEPGNPE